MWKIYYFLFVCMCFLMWGQTLKTESCCEKKEKSRISLEIAESLTEKAKRIISNCAGSVTKTSECGVKDKLFAYLSTAKKLMSKVKVKFQTCTANDSLDCDSQSESEMKKSMVKKAEESKEPVRNVPGHKSRDCSEVLQNGGKVSGVYTIQPIGSSLQTGSLDVFCDMDTDGGGWTVIQRRGNFTPQENFYRDWEDYKNGFGGLTKDFWLGNDNILAITSQFKEWFKLRFDLEDVSGNKAYALYNTFWMKNETEKYEIYVNDYSRTAGNSMAYSTYQPFSTKDRDNDRWPSVNCAADRSYGGWWYRDCAFCNPNGYYQPGLDNESSMYWYHWRSTVGLAATEIKVKRSRETE